MRAKNVRGLSVFSGLRLGLTAIVLAMAGLLALPASPSQAAVMTFSGIAEGCGATSDDPYTEDGITAIGLGRLSSHVRPGALHLDTGGSACARGAEFSTGGVFDAISAAIDPSNLPTRPSRYCSEAGEGCEEPYDNVLWEGYRGGVVVASEQFWMGVADSTYVFGDAFRDLDKLAVRILMPNFAVVGGWCWDSPCSHFDLDDVSLALASAPVPTPIPIPPSVLLLGTALLGLVGYSRLTKKVQTAA